MKIQRMVQNRINRIEPGRLIAYKTFFREYVDSPEALAKVFERLVKKGTLVRQKPGLFYKPEKGRFGQLRPDESELLKQFMYQDGRLIGYPSGPDAFRALGLSTQLSSTVTIATSRVRRRTSLGHLAVRFIQSRVKTIKRQDIQKLQLLDVLMLIKKGQDVSVDQALNKISFFLKDYTRKDQERMVRLCKKYPPRTKALLGAMLQNLGRENLADSLKKDLNPLTAYNIGVSSKTLPNKAQWSIL